MEVCNLTVLVGIHHLIDEAIKQRIEEAVVAFHGDGNKGSLHIHKADVRIFSDLPRAILFEELEVHCVGCK